MKTVHLWTFSKKTASKSRTWKWNICQQTKNCNILHKYRINIKKLNAHIHQCLPSGSQNNVQFNMTISVAGSTTRTSSWSHSLCIQQWFVVFRISYGTKTLKFHYSLQEKVQSGSRRSTAANDREQSTRGRSRLTELQSPRTVWLFEELTCWI